MVSAVVLCLFVVSVIFYLYKFGTDKPYKFPPGPPKIPIIGSYLFLLILNWKWTHKGAMILSKIYKSDIIGLYLGDFQTVVVNSYAGLKEILNRNEFDGRPDVMAANLRDPHYKRSGIFFTDGPLWKEQRRFILRYLRDYGFGRRYPHLESVINEELQDLIDVIKNGPKYPHEKEFHPVKGKVLCPYFMSACSMNSFFYVVFNEQIPRNEREIFNTLAKESVKFQRHGDPYGLLLSILPWIRHVFPQISKFRPLRNASKPLYNFIKKYVDKNLEGFSEDSNRNFIDIYIREMNRSNQKVENETSFGYDQFVMSLVDFAFPSILAITVQLSLMFQWMLLKPNIMRSIQAEIDRVVGRGRLPNLDDRKDLNYTEAAIRECLRLETLTPSSFPHRAIVDTDLMGYRIKKDTLIIPGIYAFHMNKEIWKDPEVYRPERFLDENGKLALAKDISLPFGAGKRLCAGETFSRNIMFLITSTICQNFDLVLGPEQSLPDMSKTLNGVSVTTPDFWLYLRDR